MVLVLLIYPFLPWLILIYESKCYKKNNNIIALHLIGVNISSMIEGKLL